MTIKDVEKLTGLTAKSIRYYEDKGLIKVERNEENSYRTYSEANVERLKWIKLLRYLEFSIEEIRVFFETSTVEATDILFKKAEEFQDKTEDFKTKTDICIALGKEYGKSENVLEKYEEQLEFFESEDYEEFKKFAKEASIISTPHLVVNTLIFGAPLIMLFINIQREFYSALTLNTVLAMVGIAITTWLWKDYFSNRRIYKSKMQEKGKSDKLVLLLMIPLLIAMFVAFIAIDKLVFTTMAPDGWLFYQLNVHTEWLLIILIISVLGMAFVWISKNVFHLDKRTTESLEDAFIPWELFEKFKVPIIVIWIVLAYICVTSVTYVTEDTIVHHTPLNPFGTSYAYEDVESVDVNFGSKEFAIFEYKRKGSFNYVVSVGGKEIVFHIPTVNEDIERYVGNSYLELEEFDQTLMELGAEKNSDTTYSDYCDFDQEYVDRFLRIAENK